jgi:hypothetical protein
MTPRVIEALESADTTGLPKKENKKESSCIALAIQIFGKYKFRNCAPPLASTVGFFICMLARLRAGRSPAAGAWLRSLRGSAA